MLLYKRKDAATSEEKRQARSGPQDRAAYSAADKDNNTAIPLQMKEQFEERSGFSFQDVRVHYNSDKPASLQALAYTQGNQVYIAPGQERHLEHELTHVVQQKQGRVKPTMYVGGIPVNDNAALEREADGAAYSIGHFRTQKASLSENPVAQRKLYKEPNNAKELIKSQIELQENADTIAEKIQEYNPDDKGAYTTVGFEHEFAKYQSASENRLVGAVHVSLASTKERLGLTDLPFQLETDCNNTLELVGAPFVIATPHAYPIPFPEDVQMADGLMVEALKDIVHEVEGENALNGDRQTYFEALKNSFSETMGLTFDYKEKFEISAHNFDGQSVDGRLGAPISKDSLDSLSIIFREKNAEHKRIFTQVNFAADAFVFDVAKHVGRNANSAEEFREKELRYQSLINSVIGEMAVPANLQVFLNELARNLSINTAAESLKKNSSYKKGIELIIGEDYAKHKANSTFVKDIHPFWLKDTIFNFALGIIKSKDDWKRLLMICGQVKNAAENAMAAENTTLDTVKKQLNEELLNIKSAPNQTIAEKSAILQAIGAAKKKAAESLARHEANRKDYENAVLFLEKLIGKFTPLTETGSEPAFEHPSVEYGEHVDDLLGARQDTYIDLSQKHRAPIFEDRTFHLIESRSPGLYGEDIGKVFTQLHITYKQRAVAALCEELELESPYLYKKAQEKWVNIVNSIRTSQDESGIEEKKDRLRKVTRLINLLQDLGFKN